VVSPPGNKGTGRTGTNYCRTAMANFASLEGPLAPV
jgi:hypothetical protein